MAREYLAAEDAIDALVCAIGQKINLSPLVTLCLQDARFLIHRFRITKLQIRRAMNRMIRASIPSTDLFFFQRFMDGFLKGRFR